MDMCLVQEDVNLLLAYLSRKQCGLFQVCILQDHVCVVYFSLYISL